MDSFATFTRSISGARGSASLKIAEKDAKEENIVQLKYTHMAHSSRQKGKFDTVPSAHQECFLPRL